MNDSMKTKVAMSSRCSWCSYYKPEQYK